MAQSVRLPKWVKIVRSSPAVYERDVFNTTQITSPADAIRLLSPTLATSETEQFLAVSMDAQRRALGVTKVTSGILNSSLVHPRETFRAAIVLGAASILVAHNHPSGDPTPSADDREVTAQLVAAGQILDIPVFDHIIIAGSRYTSFAQEGLL